MSDFSIEDTLRPGPERDAIREALVLVDQKVEESVYAYRALVQFVNSGMVEGADRMPDVDVLTLLVANRYALAMSQWAGTMDLPLLFARFTAKEMLRDQG